eukprot:6122196-Amphidinium_carterae.1
MLFLKDQLAVSRGVHTSSPSQIRLKRVAHKAEKIPMMIRKLSIASSHFQGLENFGTAQSP